MAKIANKRLVLAISLLLVVQMVFGPGTALTAPSESGPVVHIVRAGENLFRISLRYGTTVQAIMQANYLTSTTIYIGQQLIIPGSDVPPSGPSFTYVVKPGDTLSAIAWRFGTTVSAIAWMNGLVNPSLIYVGQHLQVPGAQPSPPPECEVWYTVQPGDTLSALALRFGTTVWGIVTANNLPNAHHIYVGQRLFINLCGGVIPTLPPPLPTCPSIPPTATPTPTATPQCVPASTATPQCVPVPTAMPQCFPMSTATPQCVPTPTPLPPPTLFEPESGANFSKQVRLKWIWPRRLESHERFVVQWLVVDGQRRYEFWVSEVEIIGSDGNIHPVAEGYRVELNFDLNPYPGGEARWSVAVFGKTATQTWQITPWSEERQIFRGRPD